MGHTTVQDRRMVEQINTIQTHLIHMLHQAHIQVQTTADQEHVFHSILEEVMTATTMMAMTEDEDLLTLSECHNNFHLITEQKEH